MKKSGYILFFLCSLSFLLFSCSLSPYHFGYHNLGNGRLLYNAVSAKIDIQTQAFEDKTLQHFIRNDVDSLHRSFAPKLAEAIPPDSLIKIITLINDQYAWDGRYERIKLVEQSYGLDKGSRRDAFSYYDMVAAEFYLFGKSDALIRMFISDVEGELKISGFEISDAESNPEGNNKIIEYVFPESIDKAGLMKTGGYPARNEPE